MTKSNFKKKPNPLEERSNLILTERAQNDKTEFCLVKARYINVSSLAK